MHPYRYLRVRPDAKGNAVFCSNSKLMIEQHWNESKKRELLQPKYRRFARRIFSVNPPPTPPPLYAFPDSQDVPELSEDELSPPEPGHVRRQMRRSRSLII